MNRDTSTAGHGPHRDLGKEKFWREALRQFAASGKSVRGFCSSRGLSEPSFYAWRRTLNQRDALVATGTGSRPLPRHGGVKRHAKAAPSAPGPASAFLPVLLTGTAQPPRIEIVLSGGTRIRLRGPVDRATLAQVVAALRAAGEEG
jgi:hypothetical protein